MHIPYVWQLTAKDSEQLLRYLKIYFLRLIPRIHFYSKAWS